MAENQVNEDQSAGQTKQELLDKARRLHAIDRVFKKTQDSESKAQVAEVCLAVAEELTESQFGFLGELNQEGRLDTIAVSASAWTTCRVWKSDTTALLQDMEVRGIWGKPIVAEGPIIVNDPASDADSVGLPNGHPAITSFLGVPLKQGGRTVGVIALANRPGGYTDTNLLDLEQVSLAVVEVLHRRHAEEAEAALRQSEQRYRRLLGAVTNYTYTVWFADGVPTTTEHGWGCLSVTGYSPQEYAADPFLWINMVHPDDRERVLRHVTRVLACEDSPPIEHRIICKDKLVRWVRDTIVYRCDNNGRITEYDGLVEDISERKQAEEALKRSEERFRSLVETTSDWIWSIDRDGFYTYASPKVKDLLGFNPEEVVGKKPYDFMLPDEAKRLAPVTQLIISSNQTLTRQEHISLHKSGQLVAFETSGVPIVDDDGELLGYQGISRDVTERKKTKEALKSRDLQLMAAQKIQEHLLPDAPPKLPGFDIGGALYPAEFAAGDYFDYLPMADGSIGFVIGDVSGHGFGPALIMASTHVLFRSLAETHSDLVEILTLANTVLVNETEDDRFVTLLLGRLDTNARVFTYASAGHSTGYVFGPAADLKARLTSTALPLAVLPEAEFRTGKPVELNAGDTLLLLTDGIEEARTSAGEIFGKSRVWNVVRENYERTAAEIAGSICAAAREFSPHRIPLDDITAVVIKVEDHDTGAA